MGFLITTETLSNDTPTLEECLVLSQVLNMGSPTTKNGLPELSQKSMDSEPELHPHTHSVLLNILVRY